jgi:hypothetical protein
MKALVRRTGHLGYSKSSRIFRLGYEGYGIDAVLLILGHLKQHRGMLNGIARAYCVDLIL